MAQTMRDGCVHLRWVQDDQHRTIRLWARRKPDGWDVHQTLGPDDDHDLTDGYVSGPWPTLAVARREAAKGTTLARKGW